MQEISPTTQWQLDRQRNPRMEYYRDIYKSPRLLGGFPPLHDKHLVIYGEQGIGDVIQFLRYIPYIKAKKITLHCHVDLHRLINSQQWGIDLLDKQDPNLPDHDFHILSLDLPMLIRNINNRPYIYIPASDILNQYPRPLIGIVWEGSPFHEMNNQRSCSLKHFKSLEGTLVSLQQQIHAEQLTEDCDDLQVFGTTLSDWYDTAALINEVDYVVTIDTAVMHLAGAMGKKTFGMLCTDADQRWGQDATETLWYPTVTLLRQSIRGEWEQVFNDLRNELAP